MNNKTTQTNKDREVFLLNVFDNKISTINTRYLTYRAERESAGEDSVDRLTFLTEALYNDNITKSEEQRKKRKIFIEYYKLFTTPINFLLNEEQKSI